VCLTEVASEGGLEGGAEPLGERRVLDVGLDRLEQVDGLPAASAHGEGRDERGARLAGELQRPADEARRPAEQRHRQVAVGVLRDQADRAALEQTAQGYERRCRSGARFQSSTKRLTATVLRPS
jgi:hypothetical protein